MPRLSIEQRLVVWQKLEQLQDTFPYTPQGLIDFAELCVNNLIPSKPSINFIQADILYFMLTGNSYRMVQAQRGQAKTTLAGIFAAFLLIHQPHYRIVIFSQTGKRATEIANWVIKIFKRIDILDFMLPNKAAGDKDNADAFDINSVLKGSDKSPSVSCYSITSGAQGARADFIIADDIESLQNSRTAAAREWLEEQSREFESINQHGDILYLGTPQSSDSIYNNLPNRGYQVRVWPGRYPTKEDVADYGEFLAPSILNGLLKDPSLQEGYGLGGKSGAPTCPEMFDDEELIRKEIALGRSKFQLQSMLNTRLSDEDRYPLKPSELIVFNFGKEEGVVNPVWNTSPLNEIPLPFKIGNRPTDKLYNPIPREHTWRKFTRKIMYIDPAGGGASGDEMAYAIVFQLENLIYIYEVGAVRGGYDESELGIMVKAAKDAGVQQVYIEENFGKGALMATIRPLFQETYPVELIDDYNTGQKELRIIDTLEPLMNSHRLIVNQKIVDYDHNSTKIRPPKDRPLFRFFTQLSLITKDKGSLRHDDRLEAAAMACSKLLDGIDFSFSKKEERERKEAVKDFIDLMNNKERRREFFGAAPPRLHQQRNIFSSKIRTSRRAW